jgi:hypothetical protein
VFPGDDRTIFVIMSLGLSEGDLTPCDMSVCGADNANIRVLGAVLVEFSSRSSPLK